MNQTRNQQSSVTKYLRSRHGTRWALWDLVVGALAFLGGFWLSPYTKELHGWSYFIIIGGFYGLLLMISSRLVGVHLPGKGHRQSIYETISSVILAVLAAYLVFGLVINFTLVRVYGRYIVVGTMGLSLLGLVLPRLLVARFLKIRPVNLVIYGAGRTGTKFYERIAKHEYFRIAGVLDDDTAKHGSMLGSYEVIGSIRSCPSERLKQMKVDVVVICVSGELKKENAAALLQLPLDGIEVLTNGAFIEEYFYETSLDYTNPHWFASLPALPGNAPIFFSKRILDILVSGVILLISLPFWPLIALAIKIDSSGPVFFRQKRVGLHGAIFKILKFRTMHENAEDNVAQWATKGDPRVTRTGRFLRRVRLDELPQMLNVLRGQMSFVGPRPEQPEFVEKLSREIPFYKHRHLTPPGITGWAQIRYQYAASNEDARRKLQFDLYYIRHLSIAFDIRIILQTIPLLMGGSR